MATTTAKPRAESPIPRICSHCSEVLVFDTSSSGRATPVNAGTIPAPSPKEQVGDSPALVSAPVSIDGTLTESTGSNGDTKDGEASQGTAADSQGQLAGTTDSDLAKGADDASHPAITAHLHTAAGLVRGPLTDSFVVLSEQRTSQGSRAPAAMANVTGQVLLADTLTKLADNTDDHALDQMYPLCQDCADDLCAKLNRVLHDAQEEKKMYHRYLSELDADGREIEQPVPEAEFAAEMAAYAAEEAELKAQVQALERERAELGDTVGTLDSQMDELKVLEESYWQEYNEVHLALQSFEEEKASIEQQLSLAESELERLKKTNVYNDAFHIWHTGPYGTINGFRLGKMPGSPKVEWSEINAAWGQATLLLHTMAAKCNFKFKEHRLIPTGSYSRIARLSDGDKYSYELYNNNDSFGFGKIFWYSRFDKAMVFYLQCLKEFGDYAASIDPAFRSPYAIEDDKIGGITIKVQLGGWDKWTKALKYLLTNLKWLLAFIAKHT